MQKNWKTIVGAVCFCGLLTSVPFPAYADTAAIQQTVRTEAAGTDYIENKNQGNSSENPIIVDRPTEETAAEEEAFPEENSIMIANDQAEEFASESVRIQESVQKEVDSARVKIDLRQKVVNYALSFLGGSYRYRGTDPRTGVDCSGFTRFIMSNAAGVQLERSSVYQSRQGVAVSADQMQPGDLIFYKKGGRISHVAIYIGSGKVVHASTDATGIKISNWNYRTPAKIVNVLG